MHARTHARTHTRAHTHTHTHTHRSQVALSNHPCWLLLAHTLCLTRFNQVVTETSEVWESQGSFAGAKRNSCQHQQCPFHTHRHSPLTRVKYKYSEIRVSRNKLNLIETYYVISTVTVCSVVCVCVSCVHGVCSVVCVCVSCVHGVCSVVWCVCVCACC